MAWVQKSDEVLIGDPMRQDYATISVAARVKLYYFLFWGREEASHSQYPDADGSPVLN